MNPNYEVKQEDGQNVLNIDAQAVAKQVMEDVNSLSAEALLTLQRPQVQATLAVHALFLLGLTQPDTVQALAQTQQPVSDAGLEQIMTTLQRVYSLGYDAGLRAAIPRGVVQ